MENIAVIDIGSNTIRLCVYAIKESNFILLAKKSNVAGLAAYVDESGNLSKNGINKLIDVLKSFKEYYKPYEIKKVLPFATASLRFVKNQKDVLSIILKEVNLHIKIISGEEEAAFSFWGAKHCFYADEGLLVDIGGASTELVYFKKNKIICCYSFPLGSLNAYEKYIKRIIPTRLEQNKIKRDILEFLDGTDISESAYGKPICGVGGSVRNSLKLYRNLYQEENEFLMKYENFKDLLKLIRSEKKENIDIILKVAPHRIHTIIPGMIILKTIAKYFKCNEIFVSKFGIREGYLLKNSKKKCYDAK